MRRFPFRLGFFCRLLLLLTLFVGCNKNSDGTPTAKTLRLCAATDPFSLDPRIAGDRNSQVIIRMLFEGLTRIGRDGNPTCAIAEKYTISEDFKVYTFYLRNSCWSNGEPVTAYDFEYSWKKTISPNFPSVFAYAFYIIKNAKLAKENKVSIDQVGIRAIDDYTLVVELEHPAPYFLELTSNPIYSPVHRSSDEKEIEWSRGNDYISNGPFRLSKWNYKSGLSLIKNTNYWDHTQVHLDEINIMIVSDSHTGLMLYERGEIDWFGLPLQVIPNDAIATLKKRKQLLTGPSSNVYWYLFNVCKYPFENQKMRKAFSYAVDRTSIVGYLLENGESPAFSVLPPNLVLRDEPLFKDHDIPRARKLFDEGLKEMGITHKQFPTITITTVPQRILLAQAIQEQWRKAFDVEVQLQCLEWNICLSKLSSRDFQIASLGWESWINDPVYNLEFLKHKSTKKNYTGWEDARYIELLDLSDHEVNPVLRTEYLRQAEELVLDQMPLIPLYYQSGAYVKREYVKGVYFNSTGNPDFTYVKIEDHGKSDY